MDYEKAKKNFEAVVTAMQEDLKVYAAGPKASQRTIDAKMATINTLVDYYQVMEELLSDEQMKNVELATAYNRLHGDTARLVIFAQLHRVNPNLVFHYTLDELNKMYDEGIRIQPPLHDFDSITVVNKGTPENPDWHLTFPGHTIEEEEKVAGYDKKYQQLNFMRGVRC